MNALQKGDETFYYFGDNDFVSFASLFREYVIPPYYNNINNNNEDNTTTTTQEEVAISWGLAASGTGVPFHTHGAVFAEVIYGYKVINIYFSIHRMLLRLFMNGQVDIDI